MTARERENYVYGGVIAGCLVFLLWLIPKYSPPYPGYGLPTTLIPNVAVGFILLLAIVELLRNFLAARKAAAPAEPVAEKDKAHVLHFLKFMVPCVLVLPAMKAVGFIPAGAVFLLLVQYLCGQRKPVTMGIVTVCAVGLMYVAMRYGLSVPMP